MTHTDRTLDGSRTGSGGGMDRWLRGRVLARLESIDHGGLTVHDADGKYMLGRTGDALQATVIVRDLRFWRLMASGGSVGAAEAWMAQWWDSPDPVAVVRVLARNRRVLATMDSVAARLVNFGLGFWHAFNRNSLKGSRRNIAAHYDLGNDFFAAWLDERMMYSSALFLDVDETLEQAQINKLERIGSRLQLKPHHHLLEIGTGWGGLAVYAASRYGCRVTTTTISREQYELARQKVSQAGLDDRVTVLMCDYRELEGRFDRIVSVEMIEAVGHHYLETYLARIDALLEADGLALIQAITIEDHRYRTALKSVDFIKRYVFPGTFIPSVSAITAAMGRATRLGLVELVDFGASYALTLRAWRQRFEAAWHDIRAMGFDETFRRRWIWYLAYCEGGFRERAISDVHLLLAGEQWRPQQETGLSAGPETVLQP